jgi:hypothetical protein
MAVDFAPLAVSLPYVPGGDVQLVARIPGCAAPCRSGGGPWFQGSEHAHGGIPEEVQVYEILCDNVQLLTGEETLYLSSEDLAHDP